MKDLKTKYYYDIELRDKDGNLYINSNGNKLASRTFQFTDETEEHFIHLVCQRTAENYKTVCKEGTQVNIDVRTYSDLTKTYPLAYSFYSAENKFVKY